MRSAKQQQQQQPRRRPVQSSVSPARTPSPSRASDEAPRSPVDSPPPLPRPHPKASPTTVSMSPLVSNQPDQRRESSNKPIGVARGSSKVRDPTSMPSPQDEGVATSPNDTNAPRAHPATSGPPAYVVLGCSGAGQIFDLMLEQLLRSRGASRSCWVDGSPLLPAVLHGQLPAIVGAKQQALAKAPATSRAGPASSSSSLSSAAAPCCDRWSSISLYLGDKTSAERCMEEARYLALRSRRKSSAAAIRRTGSASALPGQLCGHQRVMSDLRRRMQVERDNSPLGNEHTNSTPPTSSNSRRSDLPVPSIVKQNSGGQYGCATPQSGPFLVPFVPLPTSPVTLVNYIEGLKAITLKNRMVKTLRHYFRYSGWSELGQYLPVTYQMIPDPKGPNGGSTTHDERIPLVTTMCQCNAEEFEASGEIATYWIAKSSHGAHGSNIRIFFADQKGLDQLVRFIDGQRDAFPWVVSRYIDRPLLYHNRKFDIRCWVLVTPNFDIYLHEALVMRMSSETYDRSNISTDSAAGRLANITNHCVQAEGRGYAQFESGNELWRESLDELVRSHYETGMSKRERRHSRACQNLQGTRSSGGNAAGDDDDIIRRNGGGASPVTPTLDNCITPQIVRIVTDTIVASFPHIPKPPESEWRHTAEALECIYNPTASANRKGISPVGTQATPLSQVGGFPTRQTVAFQMLGYDFIIDRSLVVWLLEVNGSPGVAQSKIHDLVRDAIEVAIDPLFPQPPAAASAAPTSARHAAGSSSPSKDGQTSPNGFRRVALGTSVIAAAAAASAVA
jgi:hypothetical protein